MHEVYFAERDMERERVRVLRRLVWDHYRKAGRDLPWRRTRNPYRILVSEAMLQQTQVERVLLKYSEFLRRFPTLRALAEAPLSAVLAAWSGLGYNRRALFLKRAAELIVREHGGRVPRSVEALEGLPGIGVYTARAILCFAFNESTVFLETNIRTVFIYHFFAGRTREVAPVHDRELEPLLSDALRHERLPREWYFALMDYGAHLKKTIGNVSRASTHYTRQSTFAGSLREARGRTVRILLGGAMTETDLVREAEIPAKRVRSALSSLAHDGLLVKDGERYSLKA